MRYMGTRSLAPDAHRVGIVACIALDCGRRAAIGIALSQYWIYSTALTFGIARPNGFLFIILGIIWKIRNRIAFAL